MRTFEEVAVLGQGALEWDPEPWHFLFQLPWDFSAWTLHRRGWPPTEARCRRTCTPVQMWLSPRCRSPEPWRFPLRSADRRSCSGVWQHIYTDSQRLPTGLSLCHNHPAAIKRRGWIKKISHRDQFKILHGRLRKKTKQNKLIMHLL